MGRVSQAQARENRRRVVETASRLFREQGVHVSVADLMKAAGLTHGGFYKQFDSKEALVDEATAHAFEELARTYGLDRGRGAREPGERDPGEREAGRRAPAAQRELIEAYLSVRHRDNAAEGCPVAGLATDMARTDEGREAHRVYAEGVRDFADVLATEEEDGLVRLCTMLGALVLARATRDDPLSEDVLAAARTALTDGG
ncbi:MULTISPECIES: TetR family transcriptional regulator [unclassified Streptomyces]|uniref:TetR family transcriptional regulator n=1 Tax=unclassified Streptomyces TaxID=2593676 RepID=UPI00143279AC|nr:MULTISPECIES: TetR family transcriptional regulator [unclassified Streptomyces]MDX3086675.1 TetR family transcriptional regulator [Streptomyces sp. ME12-02E]MDX3330059.1 TetR family transcriptional regulator [Streptomyces sp. ME02-6978a]NJP74580.1 TetR family transcriptional regulator [Streptomyces sp. C1-2]